MKNITTINLINFSFLVLVGFFLLTGGWHMAIGAVFAWACVRLTFHLLAPKVVRYHPIEKDSNDS